MAIIPFKRITASPPIDAAIPAGLARLARGLVGSASKLHVAQGWGAALDSDSGTSTLVDAWSLPTSWRTFASFLVDGDAGSVWYATLRCNPVGADVLIRGQADSSGTVVSAAGIVTILVDPIDLGGGLVLVRLQVSSSRVEDSDTIQTLSWALGTEYNATIANAAIGQEWVAPNVEESSFTHHTYDAPTGVEYPAHMWPARDGAPDGNYTVWELSRLQVTGISIWSTGNEIVMPQIPGFSPLLRTQERNTRYVASYLLGSRPRQQCAMTLPATVAINQTNARRWSQRIPLTGAEQDVWTSLLTDEQGFYRFTAIVLPNARGQCVFRFRMYIDGFAVGSKDFEMGYSTPDVFSRWSLSLPMTSSGGYPVSETDAWPEDISVFPRVSFLSDAVLAAGVMRITVQKLSGAATRLGVFAAVVVAQRETVTTEWPALNERVQTLMPMLTAANEPFNKNRKEVAAWQRLDINTTDVAYTVWRASPVEYVTLKATALLTDNTVTVDIIDPDGVTVLDTLTLSTGGTDVIVTDTSIPLPGDVSYYINVSTSAGQVSAVKSLRLYEADETDPSMALSISYLSLSDLLDDTDQGIGATGYSPSYTEPAHIRQWNGADWIIVLDHWDGVTIGQRVSDLATTVGIEGAVIAFADGTARTYYDGTWLFLGETPAYFPPDVDPIALGDNIQKTVVWTNNSADKSASLFGLGVTGNFVLNVSSIGPVGPGNVANLIVEATATGAQSGTLTGMGAVGPISYDVSSALTVPIPTAWYHADDILVADGVTVTTWVDRRGSYNITGGAGGSGNVTMDVDGIGGVKALNFPGGKWLLFPVGLRTALNTAGAIEVFARTLCNNVANYGGPIGTSTANDQFFSLSDIQYANIASTARTNYAYTTANATVSHVWHASGTASSQNYYRNDSLLATTTNAWSMAATLTAGAWYRSGSAEGMNGRIREIRVFNRVLSTSERAAVVAQM